MEHIARREIELEDLKGQRDQGLEEGWSCDLPRTSRSNGSIAQPSLLLHTHRLDSHFADEIFSAIMHVVYIHDSSGKARFLCYLIYRL